MSKFYVKVKKEMIVEAPDEEEAHNVFFRKWEEDCGDNNTTEIIELAQSAEIHPATEEELDNLGD
jgi:hypothetical protein